MGQLSSYIVVGCEIAAVTYYRLETKYLCNTYMKEIEEMTHKAQYRIWS